MKSMEKMKEFFQAQKRLPDRVSLVDNSTIFDVAKFIDSHFSCVYNQDSSLLVRKPYFDRLKKLFLLLKKYEDKKIIYESDHEKTNESGESKLLDDRLVLNFKPPIIETEESSPEKEDIEKQDDNDSDDSDSKPEESNKNHDPTSDNADFIEENKDKLKSNNSSGIQPNIDFESDTFDNKKTTKSYNPMDQTSKQKKKSEDKSDEEDGFKQGSLF